MTGIRDHPVKSEQIYRSSDSYTRPLCIINSVRSNVSAIPKELSPWTNQKVARKSYHKMSISHIKSFPTRAYPPMSNLCLLLNLIIGSYSP